MAHYKFVTTWRFKQPISRVWDALNAAEDYPRWWPNIRYYRLLSPNNLGVGAQAERVVRGFLPYSLRYRTTIIRSEPPRELAYDADGDLIGRGGFQLSESDGMTTVVIPWEVSTSGRWLNLLAPALKWLFAANHNYVMRRGERGLTEWLAVGPH